MFPIKRKSQGIPILMDCQACDSPTTPLVLPYSATLPYTRRSESSQLTIPQLNSVNLTKACCSFRGQSSAVSIPSVSMKNLRFIGHCLRQPLNQEWIKVILDPSSYRIGTSVADKNVVLVIIRHSTLGFGNLLPLDKEGNFQPCKINLNLCSQAPVGGRQGRHHLPTLPGKSTTGR